MDYGTGFRKRPGLGIGVNARTGTLDFRIDGDLIQPW
jgi:hypothetical protein